MNELNPQTPSPGTSQGETPIQTTPQTPTPIITTDFLSGTETANKDALYADLFEKNADGDLMRSQAKKRSWLELLTIIMGFVMPIAVTIAILGGVHAMIRSQETNSLAENFQFLCGYMRYGVETDDPEYSCQTPDAIKLSAEEKSQKLEKDIVEHLSLYIPLKVSTATAASSSENTKAKEIYANKVNTNDIIKQFDLIRKQSQSSGLDNIICQSMSIASGNNLTVQCTVYGSTIGAGDTRQLGSSRIEAVRFLEALGNTSTSHFILRTPPTTLAVESIDKNEEVPDIYKTRTSFTVSMTFVPTPSKF